MQVVSPGSQGIGAADHDKIRLSGLNAEDRMDFVIALTGVPDTIAELGQVADFVVHQNDRT